MNVDERGLFDARGILEMEWIQPSSLRALEASISTSSLPTVVASSSEQPSISMSETDRVGRPAPLAAGCINGDLDAPHNA